MLKFLKHGALCVVLAAFTSVLSACDERPQRQDLPDFQLSRLDGGSDRLSDWQGKIVILNVWATWCAPCRAEMSSLQALSDELDPGSYAVLGLSIDDSSFSVREYLHETGIVFAKHIDMDGDLTREVLEITDIPQTLIIDSDGYLIDRIKGAKAWQVHDITAKFPILGM